MSSMKQGWRKHTTTKQRQCNGSRLTRQYRLCRAHKTQVFVSLLLFIVLAGAGIALVVSFSNLREEELRYEALGLAQDTGDWFSSRLDQAVLPLFSMAQFATELDLFRTLPQQIGPAGQAGSIPMLPGNTHRNLTGTVCDDPTTVSRFTQIASTIKENANMQGILVNIQLAPYAVVCLLHPINNTEDFQHGVFMDNSGAWGLDLLSDPNMRFIAQQSLREDNVVIAGPLSLRQCHDCDATVEKAFIARLPIESADSTQYIEVGDERYPKWGFATALINWKKLVDESGVYDNFDSKKLQFQLTRADHYYNVTNNVYDKEVVVLAETAGFHDSNTPYASVKTALETTNNEWEITVLYQPSTAWKAGVIVAVVCISLLLSGLLYTILIQKQVHTEMLSETRAQEAMVDTERNITAYFAHELRNPLGAIDSALNSMPYESLDPSTRDLVTGMKLCTDFMGGIMNNLLDVRKMEEGKMPLHSQPISLKALIQGVHEMLLPSVGPGVEFNTVSQTTEHNDWVLADMHRIQQVLTNITTNAIKYTVSGSITLVTGWEGDLAKFECIDTGPGIPKREQEQLFQRFVQRGGAPGTGLGLAIAKHIVEIMQGSIYFESDPSVKPGTSCIVLVPLQKSMPPDEPSGPMEPLEMILGEISFLIVDDVKMNRSFLKRRILKGIAPNANISEAANGEDALKLCEQTTFDVIIIDQYMEQGGGLLVGTDTIYAMRRMQVPSIIIGHSGNELEQSFQDAGADFFWQKPLPSNEIIIAQIRSSMDASTTSDSSSRAMDSSGGGST